jgi:hypothetical protein
MTPLRGAQAPHFGADYAAKNGFTLRNSAA